MISVIEAVESYRDDHNCVESLIMSNLSDLNVDVCTCQVCGRRIQLPLPKRF